MSRCLLLCFYVLLLESAPRLLAQSPGRGGYNLWAKEHVRFLASRVALEPLDARLRVRLAHALFVDGRRREAREQLQEAIRLEPDLVEAHCNLAVILQRQGHVRLARRQYEEALRLDSSTVAARVGLGTLLCEMGDRVGGVKQLEAAVRLDPEQLSARYNMAVAYHKTGDFQRALAHLEALLARDPAYPGGRLALARAAYGLGVQLLDAKQNQRALEALNRALEYEQGDVRMFFAAGLAHMACRDYQQAERCFRSAVALEPNHIPALHNLGAVCERQGRTREALEWYQRVRELSPHFATLKSVKEATYDVTYLLN